jgi:hypothetical protein
VCIDARAGSRLWPLQTHLGPVSKLADGLPQLVLHTA